MVLDEDLTQIARAKKILQMVKLIVNNIHGSLIEDKLNHKMPLEVETRWLTKLNSARALSEQFDDIKKECRGAVSMVPIFIIY